MSRPEGNQKHATAGEDDFRAGQDSYSYSYCTTGFLAAEPCAMLEEAGCANGLTRRSTVAKTGKCKTLLKALIY